MGQIRNARLTDLRHGNVLEAHCGEAKRFEDSPGRHPNTERCVAFAFVFANPIASPVVIIGAFCRMYRKVTFADLRR